MKFYELDTASRLRTLADEGILDAQDMALLGDTTALPRDVAGHLIENHIGSFPIPLGLAQHFLIDGRHHLVPMATEEPSVIAAAGNAAHRVARSGGFHTTVSRRGIAAQIVFQSTAASTAPADTVSAEPVSADEGAAGMTFASDAFLASRRDQIMQIADDAHPTLRSHGGGLRAIHVRQTGEFLEFDLSIDVGESMGANTVNTVAEAVAAYLRTQLPGQDLLMAILSNKSPDQRVKAQAHIDVAQLATPQRSGEDVARRIVAAARFAQCSQMRAATHNKGIMNGIAAVALATGNDVRNLMAAAYADFDDTRRTWTTWQYDGDQLVGTIDIAMPIGSVGGAISTLPMARLSMKLMDNPSAAQLMGIMASVGLASNLAALRALVTKGIQAGHMNLQLRSLAMMAGAQGEQVETLTVALRRDPSRASLAEAKRLLQQLQMAEIQQVPEQQQVPEMPEVPEMQEQQQVPDVPEQQQQSSLHESDAGREQQ